VHQAELADARDVIVVFAEKLAHLLDQAQGLVRIISSLGSRVDEYLSTLRVIGVGPRGMKASWSWP